MSDTPLERVREICLALPEATEKLTWGETATFRVRDKIFAMMGVDESPDRAAEASMSCKAAPGAQEFLVGADAARFFVPRYVGQHGWIGVRFAGDVDWEQIADLVQESYRMTAPKRLTAALDRG